MIEPWAWVKVIGVAWWRDDDPSARGKERCYRWLCVDPVVSPLSFEGVSNCGEVEIQHFIFQNDKRPLFESRLGSIRVLNETGNVSYGEVN